MKSLHLMLNDYMGAVEEYEHSRAALRSIDAATGRSNYTHVTAPEQLQQRLEKEWYLRYAHTSLEMRIDHDFEKVIASKAFHDTAISTEDSNRLFARQKERAVFDRTIPLLGFGKKLQELAATQLKAYGYVPRVLFDCGEIANIESAGKMQLLFLHTSLLAEGAYVRSEILRMRQEGRETRQLVFFADEDNFQLRLKALRSGSDAFYVLPADFGQVAEKMQQLLVKKIERPLHIVIVTDDSIVAAEYTPVLQRAGMVSSTVSDPEHVFSTLVEFKPDLILLSTALRGCKGLELAQLLRQHDAFFSIPVLFIIGNYTRAEDAAEIRSQGYELLDPAASPEDMVSSIGMKARRYRKLRYYMERDSLTGLLDHSNLKSQLQREVMRSRRTGIPLSFAMIDADHFKRINDMYGHLTGDRVLKSLSRVLQARLRRTDIIGRYGGEEFGIILLNTGPSQAVEIMDEIRKNFTATCHQAGTEHFYVSFSCGISSYEGKADEADLNRQADEALYAAKENGRNRVVHYLDIKRF